MKNPVLSLLSLALLFLGSCTIVTVDSGEGPPRVESRGLIKGHVAFGFSDEHHLGHLSLLQGRSPGAIAEVAIWKLFRLELGLAGASVGVGPLHVGLGVLFYDPEIPVERRHGTSSRRPNRTDGERDEEWDEDAGDVERADPDEERGNTGSKHDH